MTATRRSIPFASLAVLTVLGAGAAVFAVETGPSPDQLALQAAFSKTSGVDDFRFTVNASFRGPNVSNVTGRAVGVWQSPNRLQLMSRDDSGSTFTTTVIGSSLYLQAADRTRLALHLRSSVASPFTPKSGSAFFLPPLGDVTTATDIVRHDNNFSFIVPRIRTSEGWVAYAPESQHAHISTFATARHVRETVTVANGFIVAISYPRGIHSDRADVMGRTAWRLFDFGVRTRVVAPERN